MTLSDSAAAVVESPNVPVGILRDMARDWDWIGVRHEEFGIRTRTDLNGDGREEVEMLGMCGSAELCVSYYYRQEADGAFTRLLAAETAEGGLEPLRHRTHGYRDLRSEAPMTGTQRPVPVIYRYDGTEYQPNGLATAIPHSLSAADLNGDGRMDLLVGGYTGTTFLLPGDGRGGFGAPSFTTTPRFTDVVTLADVNRDGRADLVVAPEYSAVRLHPGDGRGGFGAARELADSANWLAVADMNGDGAPDLVATRQDHGTVTVMLNDGRGGFRAARGFSADARLGALAVADLDGDGRQDVAVADAGALGLDHRVAILRGDGRGGLGARTDADAGFAPSQLHVADVDGDGKPDVVASGQVRNVAVLLNRGGSFAVRQVPVELWVDASAVGDVNGDGRPDLVAATSRYRDVLVVLLGTGGGRFRRSARLPVGRWPAALAIADVNGDGKPDIAVANEDSDDIALLMGRGDGTFGRGAVVRLRRPFH
ncbi:VCBS repeat-containing protein [Longimicrobium sp.]|uniref:FG-GAP repeat domain-containing protein n=1 Tax=Longimicrobium sp. TaxID=2029185 RepID=UPI002CECD8A2|nr:VCBS repeat-containing protein [Longimicrobium sp.]HSU14162.1 VCBS repeat-containing protein [Longimicrobium sp.]